jgi:hypothetical protein
MSVAAALLIGRWLLLRARTIVAALRSPAPPSARELDALSKPAASSASERHAAGAQARPRRTSVVARPRLTGRTGEWAVASSTHRGRTIDVQAGR